MPIGARYNSRMISPGCGGFFMRIYDTII
jgi:hypothetical protein